MSRRRRRQAASSLAPPSLFPSYSHQEIVGILDAITDAFFSLDRSMRFTYVSPKTEEFLKKLNKSSSDLPGKNIWEEFPELRSTQAPARFQQALDSQVRHSYETYYDPLKIWFEVHLYPTANGLMVALHDITVRKRAEDALRDSNEFNQQIISNAGEGIVVYDSELRYVVWNAFMENLTGLTSQEVLGRKATDVFPHLREQGVYDLLLRALAGEPTKSGDVFFYVPQTGRSGWVMGTYVPNWSARGEVIGIIGVISDISEHKRVEQALRHSEQRYRTYISHSSEGIYRLELRKPMPVVLPHEEQIDWLYQHAYHAECNLAMARMYGYNDPADIIGLPLERLMPRSHPQNLEYWHAFLHDDYRAVDLESHELDKNGNLKYFLNTIVGIVENGMLTQAWGTQRDISDRKRMEEALIDSERKYRTLIEQSNDAIYLLYNGKFEITNKKFREMFGVTAEEVRSPDFNFLQLVAPESVPIIEERQRKVARGESVPLRYEFTARARDGHRIEVEASVSYVTYKGGMAVQGILRDVSDRKRSEEGLKHMLSLLQSTLESTADGILLVDLNGRIVSFNRRFAQMWNLPQEVLDTGDDEKALAHVIDQLKNPDAFLEKVRELYARPEAESFDIIEFKDGRLFERYSIPQWAEGVAVGRVWSFRDVTDRKKAEEALRASEARYRSLFEESKDAVFISSVDGHFIDINPAGVELFGYSSKEELMKVDIANELYYNPYDRILYQRVVEQQDFVKDFELNLRRKDGEKLTVLETATAVRNEQGTIVGYRGIIRDITERKRLEEQLRQAQKLQSIGTLAGGIAHDFNNILGIILGYASRLSREDVTKERLSRSIEAINRAVDRGAALVRQLLTFARQTEVQLESVNVNVVVEEIVKMLRETFPKTITLATNLDARLPSIVADSNQLHQALLNLCLNARDAMPNGGQLLLSTETVHKTQIKDRFEDASEDRYVHVSITDTGMGMDRGTLNRIFEPFFTTKQRGRGTGLGLAVVYGIIESHRGFVTVESEVGRGTTFHLYFPVPPIAVQPPETRTVKHEEIPAGTETILVVEDEEMLLDLLQAALENKGYRVLTATDGEEAIAVFREHQTEIAVVLSDIGLPRMGGWETFLKMKEISPSVKVILASGYLDVNVKMEMARGEVIDFVQKPYNPDDVLRRLRAAIDRTT